jgi:teichuronic acid exporter
MTHAVPSMDESEVRQRLKKAAFAVFIGRYLNVAVQLGVTAVLARLLAPGEFGVVAQFMVFVIFFNLLGEIGIGPAVIYFSDLGRDGIATLFWLMAGGGLGLFAASWVTAVPVARFFGAQEYVHLAHALAWIILFTCLAVVPANIIRREGRFSCLAYIEVAASITSGAVAIILARRGAGVSALVWKAVVQVCLYFFLCMLLSGVRPRLRFDFAVAKRIWSYSGYQAGFNILNYFSRNADSILIGKFMGQSSLGLYNMAYRLMTMPITSLTGVIAPVLQPIYTQIKAEPDQVRESYAGVVHILAVLGGVVTLECCLAGRELVFIFCGEKWIHAVPVFQILGTVIWVQVILASSGGVWQALGETKLLFFCGIFSSSANVLAIVVGVCIGTIESVATGLVIAFVLSFIQCYWLMARKIFQCSIVDLLSDSKLAFAVVLSGIPICLIVGNARFWAEPGLIGAFVLKTIFLFVGYAMALMLAGDSVMFDFLKRADAELRRVLSAETDI